MIVQIKSGIPNLVRNAGLALFSAAFLAGCYDHEHKFEGYSFTDDAYELRLAQQYWATNSKSEKFNISTFEGPGTTSFFNYTNVIKVSNGVFKCLFAAHRKGQPFGILAITRDRTIIWISDKDGQVTVDPEKNGVDGKNE